MSKPNEEPAAGELGWRCRRCLRVFAMEIDPGFVCDGVPISLVCRECATPAELSRFEHDRMEELGL